MTNRFLLRVQAESGSAVPYYLQVIVTGLESPRQPLPLRREPRDHGCDFSSDTLVGIIGLSWLCMDDSGDIRHTCWICWPVLALRLRRSTSNAVTWAGNNFQLENLFCSICLIAVVEKAVSHRMLAATPLQLVRT